MFEKIRTCLSKVNKGKFKYQYLCVLNKLCCDVNSILIIYWLVQKKYLTYQSKGNRIKVRVNSISWYKGIAIFTTFMKLHIAIICRQRLQDKLVILIRYNIKVFRFSQLQLIMIAIERCVSLQRQLKKTFFVFQHFIIFIGFRVKQKKLLLRLNLPGIVPNCTTEQHLTQQDLTSILFG